MKSFRFHGFTMPQSVEYFVNDIMSNRLPCNNPINFNDPFEGLCFFNGLTDDEEKRLKVYNQDIDFYGENGIIISTNRNLEV